MLLQHSYPVISYKIPRLCAMSVGGLVGYNAIMPTAQNSEFAQPESPRQPSTSAAYVSVVEL